MHIIKAVYPSELTCSGLESPVLINSLATSFSPFWHANINAVFPSLLACCGLELPPLII